MGEVSRKHHNLRRQIPTQPVIWIHGVSLGEINGVTSVCLPTRDVEEVLSSLSASRTIGSVPKQTREVKEALRNSQSFLQTIIDDIPELLMVVDRDHRIVLANRAVREVIGEQDPVAGCMTCHQASHHRDRPCDDEDHPCPLNQVVSTKAPASTR